VIVASDSSFLEQQCCSRQWAAITLSPLANKTAFSFAGRTNSVRRLRIGYLSADFHEHATAYLTAGMFDSLDRQSFDQIAYSHGPIDDSAMQRRLRSAFTRFEDIRKLSFEEAAHKIYADGIDILADLKGCTLGSRSEILAYRAAPIQVRFLGFPGTMAPPLVDYIIADRFIVPFAQKLPLEQHLGRLRLADLVLDTLPYNAGTTASDALWVGVPVLTCVGNAFVSRMAGSLLQTRDLAELVTNNWAHYEQRALELARQPEKLPLLKTKVAAKHLTSPLFNADRFSRHLEAAYQAMWERYQRGQTPAPIAVPAVLAQNSHN